MLAVVVALSVAGMLAPVYSVIADDEPGGVVTPQAVVPDTFSYQGRLVQNGQAVSGVYDFQFRLYDSAAAAVQVGPLVAVEDLQVTNGLFSTQLGFGAAAFNGQSRFLEVRVRPGASTGGFELLAPLQELTATPYALYAKTIPLAGDGVSTSAAHADHNHVDESWVGDIDNGYGLRITNNGDQGIGLSAEGAGTGVIGRLTNGQTFGYLATEQGPTLKAGVAGFSLDGYGAVASSQSNIGILAQSNSGSLPAIRGLNGADTCAGTCIGVEGIAPIGFNQQLDVNQQGGVGVSGTGTLFGVQGKAPTNSGIGVRGEATGDQATGVFATSNTGHGVYATTSTKGKYAVYGINNDSTCNNTAANLSFRCVGIWGEAVSGSAGIGVLGTGTNVGLYGIGTGGGYAGLFVGSTLMLGNLQVSGVVTKAAGSFKIDNPLDPANSYLQHSFVESPDMKNLYDGLVTTDGQGFATVTMPDWFEALNMDFRYQLTVIGKDSWARARVYEELTGNSFVIQTDIPGTKVSWQVTGTRHDTFANENRIPIVTEKPAEEKGTCMYAPACD
ncbi:hypothetical protein AYO38_05000 [bacterium SCGC AG-212-C10]|nr:hypothetical protein AYO38_05000 [bacterium SCGC AG-212-C10]